MLARTLYTFLVGELFVSNQSSEPFAPSAPAGIPVAPLSAPARVVELSRVKPVVTVVAYVVYALVCIIGVFVLNHRVSLTNQLIQGGSVDVDQANAADNAVSTMGVALIAALVFLLVAAIISERNFAKALGKESARRIRNQVGLRIVTILWLVLWTVGTVTQDTMPNDPHSLVSADHRSMFLLGARALLMIVIAALTPLAYRKARAELASRPAPQPLAPLGY